MVEIGHKPILWHIMKSYSAYGVTDFIICCGYKGYIIKEYFANYALHMSDITFDLQANNMSIHQRKVEPWKVTLVETGEETMTGGRLKRVADYVRNEECFCFTYGDGVSNVDIAASIAFHKEHGRLATVTAVRPPGRYGSLAIDEEEVMGFSEKPPGDGGFVNGGYFVLSPRVIDYIEGDATPWEVGPLERLALDRQMKAFVHTGFWQPMDTMRDKIYLESLWNTGRAPWKVW